VDAVSKNGFSGVIRLHHDALLQIYNAADAYCNGIFQLRTTADGLFEPEIISR
jgi:hypothetical protein